MVMAGRAGAESDPVAQYTQSTTGLQPAGHRATLLLPGIKRLQNTTATI